MLNFTSRNAIKLGAVITPLIIVGCFGSQAALAGGSLSFTEILPLVNQSKKLQKEINQTLLETGKKPSDITCVGERLGKRFAPLDAFRVAPFRCQFKNDKYLTVEARNIIKLPNGKSTSLEKFEKLTNKPKSASLNFRLKSWNWTKS
ncbi:hypothetical protein NIES4071_100310 [Calothrix sp. NIES-4071]|nr:hypothetical protein NIES4071_100310 [Calothrix sp. NIES-4071]BAZ64293.1 hypothetical protein NIES4105_100240 [Calothrix sp. NIES-4105]